MAKKKHPNDQSSLPGTEEAGPGEGSFPDGQPMPEDNVESEGEKQAREIERGVDRAMQRITPD